ncbi:MAG: polyprenyl synthetase family protein [Candidatus Acidiferrales bacterium]
MKLPDFFDADRAAIEHALDQLLPAANTAPASIHEAMRYSVFAGGKRIRPILCYQSSRIFSADSQASIPIGCALEFIHTYSLIHDDLPALDDDDLRRGQPTCHKKFGEAIAILAGDGLLTLAFQTLAEAPLDGSLRVRIIGEVAHAAGTVRGMVGGQVADLEAEGKPVDSSHLEYIHRSKTAALIRASVLSGAVAGGANDAEAVQVSIYGENIGWLFQVIDDILDVEESSTALGKTAGKDQAQRKATYPAVFGLERSRQFAAELATRAVAALDGFGKRGENLRQVAEFLLARRA